MTKPWPMVPLGEVAVPVERPEEPISGVEYRQIGVRLWGEGAYERETIDGGQTKYKTLSRVEKDDIIVNKIWARNGSVAVVSVQLAGCYGSGEFPTFAPLRDKLEPRWIHWLTKRKDFWDKCDEKSRGTSGKNRIRPERFLEIEIPLPSLSEQKRIVARIGELAAKIEEAKGLREKAVEEAEALNYAASARFFDRNNSDVPMFRLEEVVSRITKGESPEWQGFSYQESGALFIRSENVSWGYLDRSQKTFIPMEFHQKLKRSQLQSGDVLINLVGASIGRSCVVPENIGDANVNQAVAVISPFSEKLYNHYLMHFLLSPPAQDIIHGGKVETARPNISLGDLRNLVLPVPSLNDQRRIVAYLDDLQTKVDALKRLQAGTAVELDSMLPSVLDRAFKGEM